MAFLPVALFRDRRPALAILIAWILSAAGSFAIGWILTRLATHPVGADMGDAPPMVKFVGVALFSPIVETVLMAGVIGLLRRWLTSWQAVVASAALWGIAHSLMAPLWGAVIWWPFLLFSTVFVTWRHRGWWTAVAIAASVHILQNVVPAAIIAFG